MYKKADNLTDFLTVLDEVISSYGEVTLNRELFKELEMHIRHALDDAYDNGRDD